MSSLVLLILSNIISLAFPSCSLEDCCYYCAHVYYFTHPFTMLIIFKDSKGTTCSLFLVSLHARYINMHFLRHGKHILKDSVHLITNFYGQPEYDKPLEC